jgi:hypothetical protein
MGRIIILPGLRDNDNSQQIGDREKSIVIWIIQQKNIAGYKIGNTFINTAPLRFFSLP